MEIAMGEPATDVGKSTINVELDGDLARQLDAWRRRQSRIPTTSAAVRKLLAHALADQHAAA
jgi:hypothetical protein